MAGVNAVTVSVDLSKLPEDGTYSVPINLDPSLENTSGITEADLTVEFTGLESRTFEVSNIELVNRPSGYQATAETKVLTVTVRGDPEALNTVDASQLRIVADLSDVTAAGLNRVPVKVYLDASSDVGVVGDYTIVVNVSR